MTGDIVRTGSSPGLAIARTFAEHVEGPPERAFDVP
jgi:hypothetical protein